MCQNGSCIPGCKSNNDCAIDETCVDKQCTNPCKKDTACGRNAVCKVSNHRKICLCPDGYQGDPMKTCSPYECRKNDDCDLNQKCGSDGACKNPCLETNVCGINAQCKVVNRQAQCSCPLGYIGNAKIECRKGDVEQQCLKNPCGINAKCKDTPNGYMCSCAPGCVGDPLQSCKCQGPLENLCKDKLCGTNAECRVVNGKQAQCYCSEEYPLGDPTIECT